MEREGESPTFAVCEAADRPEFYVRVAWPSGGETRLDRFATRRDAEGWTAREFRLLAAISRRDAAAPASD